MADIDTKTELDRMAQHERERLNCLSLKKKLEQSEKSFYLPYSTIQTVTVKKKRFSNKGKMAISTQEGLWISEFPLATLEAVQTAVKTHLTTKMKN